MGRVRPARYSVPLHFNDEWRWELAQNYFEGIEHTIYISTDGSTGCEHCGEWVGGDKFAAPINHYIEKHDYKLLHVGSETTDDHAGNPWHKTVAVLGK